MIRSQEFIPATVLRWESTETAREFESHVFNLPEVTTAWVDSDYRLVVMLGEDTYSIGPGAEVVVIEGYTAFVRSYG